jgi:hypothetical protein
MSRTVLPFAADDVSALAKSLGRELAAHDGRPGHVQLLNMLARGAGYRNFQHFRARTSGESIDAPAVAPPKPVDAAKVDRAVGYFDAEGRMKSWPSKTSLQALCLWVLWARMPAGESFPESGINGFIKAAHLFGDHALLRREMFNQGLLSRTLDCRDYRRIERRPPAEALALIRRVSRA